MDKQPNGRKATAIAVMVIASLFGCGKKENPRPISNEALLALKRLEARTEVGMTKVEYSPALGEAYFAVKQYLESAEAKSSPEFAKALKKTIYWYMAADEFWEIEVKRSFLMCDSIDEDLCTEYASLLSEEKPPISAGTMLRKSWAEAAKQLTKAESLRKGN